MTQAAELFIGRTVHERRTPHHRFAYRVALIMIDLERLEEADSQAHLFSVNRFNLYGFHERDHGPRDGSSLISWARGQFEQAGINAHSARIRLLCSPRVAGYVFNPISIYFAEQDGRLHGVIYQVHNTFGDSHAYIVPAGGGRRESHSADKVFHVSPFFDVSGRYDFMLRQPNDRFKLVIRKQTEAGPDFLATMALKARALTSPALLGLFASQPFSTLKTIGAIHFEALRLWLKGARYHSRPTPPGKPSLGQRTSKSDTPGLGQYRH